MKQQPVFVNSVVLKHSLIHLLSFYDNVLYSDKVGYLQILLVTFVSTQ